MNLEKWVNLFENKKGILLFIDEKKFQEWPLVTFGSTSYGSLYEWRGRTNRGEGKGGCPTLFVFFRRFLIKYLALSRTRARCNWANAFRQAISLFSFSLALRLICAPVFLFILVCTLLRVGLPPRFASFYVPHIFCAKLKFVFWFNRMIAFAVVIFFPLSDCIDLNYKLIGNLMKKSYCTLILKIHVYIIFEKNIR